MYSVGGIIYAPPLSCLHGGALLLYGCGIVINDGIIVKHESSTMFNENMVHIFY